MSDTTTDLPPSATMGEAINMLMSLPDDGDDGDKGATTDAGDGNAAAGDGGEAAATAAAGDGAAAAGDGGDGQGDEGDGGEPADPDATAVADAPDFWATEDKAAWAKVPAELKPVLQKYEHQRTAFVNQKAQEAADARQKAQQEAAAANNTVVEAAKWWQKAWPEIQKNFNDKWAGVDWVKLARENPAEYTALKAQQDSEVALLQEANRRGQADAEKAQKIAEQQAASDLVARKTAAHTTLAQRMPEFFGAPQTAQKTYSEIGEYLLSKGIDRERINAIAEPAIIEMALNSMRFERARTQASAVTGKPNGTGKTANTATPQTPTRVAPGPATRPGNQQREAHRQASERFRATGSIDDAANLIRQLGV